MSPRPPAPCSLAPGLPLSRRPAHRRLLAVVALAVLLIAATAPAVSAETIFDETYTETGWAEATCTVYGSGSGSAIEMNGVVLSSTLASNDFKHILIQVPAGSINNYAQLPDSFSEDVDLYIGDKDGTLSDYYGTARYGYFKFSTKSNQYLQIWIEFYEVIPPQMPVDLYIQCVSNNDDAIYPTTIGSADRESSLNGIIGGITTSNPGYKAAIAGTSPPYYFGALGGDNLVIIGSEWENRLTVDVVGTTATRSIINVYRDYSTKSGMSEVYVSFGETIYYRDGENDVQFEVFSTNYPFNVDIKSILGNWHNKTFFAEGPSVVESCPVTVYVRNSQTGALLANAHLTVQDTTTEPWTEVVNETLSSGTGTFSLPKDTGFHLTQYRIGATVPGYQQLVPALFFRVTGPTNVVVEMEPLAGGPADPDNTYLEFYVRDLNANGIPNANVLVDGQLRWTNAQGYTQIEVAKNASYPYSVSKSGYVTIEGRATVTDAPRHTVNVVLGAGEIPTHTPTLGPGETPGATPTPDRRTNEQKGQAVIDMIADFAEPIALLAIVATVFGLMQMMMPRRR